MPKGQMRLYRKVARLRANSNFVAEAIKREISGNQIRKVVMVPNPLPFTALTNIDLNQKKKVLLYTGRLHPEKGLELLIKAFKNLQTGWLVKIVGPHNTAAGGGGDSYLHSLKKLSEGLNIKFIGPVYGIEELNKYYAEAALFVYPSVAEQGETFGLAPLEAMAWGCVPIVSNLSCFQDFITNGTNGLIFDHRSPDAIDLLGKAIMRLSSDAELRISLAHRAIEVRNSHSTSAIAEEFLDDFAKVLLTT
jgi:glycosyltransferase involved in cell wall biosynthesis